jgi:hypothetical protein
MEHGLAQYEARERLLWFLFLLVCLLMALPAGWIHLAGVPRTPEAATTLEAIKTYSFWSQRYWMHAGPLGKVLAYLAWVAILFVLLRFLWLVGQFAGKSVLLRDLREMVSSLKSRQAAKLWDSTPEVQKRSYAGYALMGSRLNHPLRFLLHAYRRAQYTLSAGAGMPFTDGLLERQQRLSDMDRQLFRGSWAAFRWILRLLPVLAALQSFWVIYSETQLFLGKQSELEDFVNAFWPAMLPLVQMAILAVVLGLVYAFLNRMEGLYLANLDASLYDQMLTELPIRSSDTLLLLESMQKHFRDLQVALKRLELELKNKK